MTTTERLARYETAQFILDMLMAHYRSLTCEEQAKTVPDAVIIQRWNAEEEQYFQLERDLRLGDDDAIERILTNYGPKAKALFAARQPY